MFRLHWLAQADDADDEGAERVIVVKGGDRDGEARLLELSVAPGESWPVRAKLIVDEDDEDDDDDDDDDEVDDEAEVDKVMGTDDTNEGPINIG